MKYALSYVFWMSGVALMGMGLLGCTRLSPTSGIRPEAAQTRLQLGMEYLAQGDLNAAHENLVKALNNNPRDYRTQLGMALYEQRIGETDAAHKYYQQAHRLAAGNGTVSNNYGAFLCSLGQYVPAQQQFSVAASVSDHGQVADSLENSGYCFLRANQPQQAQAVLMQALQADANKGTALLVEAEKRFTEGKSTDVQLLLDVYCHVLPASADSLWLQIRFAASSGDQDNVQRYGTQLARSFPQSKQYQQFLANEY